ncbi:MAG: hypothetical protein Q8O67_33375 [Deltaproteobacteria bacterium]|nr:hypothetical protein [Deltaproteobacteria bacterium]
MRTLAFILSIALSGFGSLAAGAIDAQEEAGSCCPGESKDEQPCSPVCHECVCSLGARMLAPERQRAPHELFVPAPVLTPLDDDDDGPSERWLTPPREPSLDGVFHPPRR